MPSKTFTISGANWDRLRNAIVDRFDYEPTIDVFDPDVGGIVTIPNPESPAQFAERIIDDRVKFMLKRWVLEFEQGDNITTFIQGFVELDVLSS